MSSSSGSKMDRLYVGRDRDLALVEDRLGRLSKAGVTISVRGEPGIGKSAFLSAIADRAAQRDLRVLGMTGTPSETQMPFAGLHQLVHVLKDETGRLPPLQRRALLAACGMADEPVAPDIYLVGLAALALVAEAAQAGAVLIVDDAHWLDQPTFEVIAFVARRIQAERVCLVGAFRQDSTRIFGGAEALDVVLTGLDNDAAIIVCQSALKSFQGTACNSFQFAGVVSRLQFQVFEAVVSRVRIRVVV